MSKTQEIWHIDGLPPDTDAAELARQIEAWLRERGHTEVVVTPISGKSPRSPEHRAGGEGT